MNINKVKLFLKHLSYLNNGQIIFNSLIYEGTKNKVKLVQKIFCGTAYKDILGENVKIRSLGKI